MEGRKWEREMGRGKGKGKRERETERGRIDLHLALNAFLHHISRFGGFALDLFV